MHNVMDLLLGGPREMLLLLLLLIGNIYDGHNSV